MFVNGVEKKARNGMTLLELIEEEGFDAQRVAVEKNGQIVPKKLFAETILCDSDKLEVVCFVGGG
ncbi:MAG: sulfur carrier protein ThiS [Spirochaetes bacterium]|nr:sulfur carrier protein ThiS [Spirochaetota bacterium]